MSRVALISLLVSIGIAVAVLSYVFSFASFILAKRFGVLKMPGRERDIHTRPIPEWGGLGIAAAIVISCMLARIAFPDVFSDLKTSQLIGYLAGVGVLLIGGAVDDARPLPPFVQILFPVLAALCVIVSGTGIVQVTNPVERGGLSLVWWHIGGISFPADLLTFTWIVIATYATKILDGLDGLVAGITVIGAGIVGALSSSVAFFQPAVALVASIVGGAYLGFLPRNTHPAKQFLGESGSTIAGFSLAVLAVLSSAKIAVALSVLAIPITDYVLVAIGRIRRGVPWYRGDTTHLHFRLLQVGLSQRSAVFLLWGVSLVAGLLALTFQTKGKLFLIGTLIVGTALASYLAGMKTKRQK